MDRQEPAPPLDDPTSISSLAANNGRRTGRPRVPLENPRAPPANNNMEWIAARQALAMIAVVAVVETGELSSGDGAEGGDYCEGE